MPTSWRVLDIRQFPDGGACAKAKIQKNNHEKKTREQRTNPHFHLSATSKPLSLRSLQKAPIAVTTRASTTGGVIAGALAGSSLRRTAAGATIGVITGALAVAAAATVLLLLKQMLLLGPSAVTAAMHSKRASLMVYSVRALWSMVPLALKSHATSTYEFPLPVFQVTCSIWRVTSSSASAPSSSSQSSASSRRTNLPYLIRRLWSVTVLFFVGCSQDSTYANTSRSFEAAVASGGASKSDAQSFLSKSAMAYFFSSTVITRVGSSHSAVLFRREYTRACWMPTVMCSSSAELNWSAVRKPILVRVLSFTFLYALK
mmetsp:Transcript_38194/g.85266  ORF Transcript_38194/g.85266 Transcript_38194/m.85266 type:complete len:316 (+) Transcript_38194:65-1012(+)